MKDPSKKQYEKLYFFNNRLCGVILIGDLSRMAELSQALEKKASFQEVVKQTFTKQNKEEKQNIEERKFLS